MGDRATGLPALLPMTEEEREKGTGRAAAAGEQSEGARASEAAQTVMNAAPFCIHSCHYHRACITLYPACHRHSRAPAALPRSTAAITRLRAAASSALPSSHRSAHSCTSKQTVRPVDENATLWSYRGQPPHAEADTGRDWPEERYRSEGG